MDRLNEAGGETLGRLARMLIVEASVSTNA
jgi:hypothetical protein